MAEKQLKSIKFAGLGDTYVLPEIDDSLSTSGMAADAKATGDALAEKANTSDVNSALAGKANTSDVNSALAGKANTSDVNSALAGKVNTTDVINAAHGGTGATDGNGALYNLMVRQDFPSSSATLGWGEYRLIGGAYSWYGLPDGAWGSLIRIPGWDGYNFELCTITAGPGEGFYYRNFMTGNWTRVALPSEIPSSGGSSGAVNYVQDKTTGTPTYLNFASDGMSSTDWIAAWDGYTLRAISPSALKNVLGVSSGGSGMSREFNSGAINTTSYSYPGNQAKIYTVTTYHSESGTRHTFVFDYMAVAANGNKLRLSNYTAYGNVSVLMGIQGSSVGFESTNCTLTNVCGYY